MLYTETIERETFELLKTLMQDEKLKSFNLVGGTALALYIGHRKSIDLDLFSTQVFDMEQLKEYLISQYNFKIDDPSKISRATLIGSINEVKVDCISYNYSNVKPIIEFEGIRLTSMLDIAAMKLTAIAQSGNRLKDFIDIAFLSTQLSLKEILDAFEKKFPNTNKVGATKGLTYFEDIDFSINIDMINGKYSWKEIEKRLYDMVEFPEKKFPTSPKLIKKHNY
jgi:hypothetical protein